MVAARRDRLSRDLAFIAGLMVQGVPFIIAELDDGLLQGNEDLELHDVQRPCPEFDDPVAADEAIALGNLVPDGFPDSGGNDFGGGNSATGRFSIFRSNAIFTSSDMVMP